ncbi:MAG: MBL fold metallo-hydrolase RNA specificity domain-containing protein [Planctomycetota bacterium]
MPLIVPSKTARDATILVVHGDEDVALGFAEALREKGHRRVLVPSLHQEIPLGRGGAPIHAA